MLNMKGHCNQHDTYAEVTKLAHAQHRTHSLTPYLTHSRTQLLEVNPQGARVLQAFTFTIIIQHDTAAYSLAVTFGAWNGLLAPQLP